MKYILTFFVFSLTILVSTQVQAQTVDEFFHGAANAFINADMQNALETVNRGLSQYPDNANLSQLKRLIEEEKERQEQQQQDQQQSSEQQEEDGQQQEQEQTNEQEEQEQKEASKQDENQTDNLPDEIEDGEDLIPNEISKEDADKILKALAQKEKDLLKEFKKPQSKSSTTHEKDW